MGREFYIVSVVHTERQHPYITFWRPKNSGYCWPLSWAGRYAEADVRDAVGYYNSGDTNIAVSADAVDALTEAPKSGAIDGDAGPVVRNTAYSWGKLLGAVIESPASTPQPEYRGRRKAA